MHLFNRKTLNKKIGTAAPIPAAHLSILQEWAATIEDGSLFAQKETALHGLFKSKIIEGVLGYTPFGSSGEWSVDVETHVGAGRVDLALGAFTQGSQTVVAPFELKGAKTKDLDAIMPGRNKSPVQQAWEYAVGTAGCKWVLVSNYTEIRFYSYAEGNQAFETFNLEKLADPQEYARFMLLLSEDTLLSGATEALLQKSREEDKEITDHLYDDYKANRDALIKALKAELPTVELESIIGHAQTLLDRVLFIAFAEDTGLLPSDTLKNAYEHSDPYNPKPVWGNFCGLFRAINEGNKSLNIQRYNGGLFKENPTLDSVNIPDEVCEGFKKLGDYDFASEISVTILGHMFEQSISDVERMLSIARGEIEDTPPSKAKGTRGRRKRDGVVYTPDYIARFIVEQTLGTHITELQTTVFADFISKGSLDDYEHIKWRRSKKPELTAWKAYQQALVSLKIVDPACGSGAFLVAAFDYLKAEYHRVNTKIEELEGKLAGGLFDPDSEILSHNLYGVDVNAESVEISKLSLWLKTAKKGKQLDGLDHNIRVGDSLIEDSSFAYLKHAFVWKDAFPEVFTNGGFDVVLGNPPYVRQELIKSMKPYLKKRFEVYHGVADLYCYFFERGLRLLKSSGRLGYISSNTFFKTNSGKPLKNFLRENASIESVINFGDIQIFEGVTTYPAILTMRHHKPHEDHQLKFWKLDDKPDSNFLAMFLTKQQSYPQLELSEESWELEGLPLRKLRKKITNDKKSLKEVYGSPYRGIVTGLNEAFVIEETKRNKLILEDPKSADVLKPYLEGKDLKRWRVEPQSLWLIFMRRGIDLERYPAVKNHLTQYKERLMPKPKGWVASIEIPKWLGRKSGTYKWYEIQDTIDYHHHFDAEKIVYPHFNVKNLFSIEKSSAYSNDKSYLIPSNELNLLSLLNSKLSWFLLSAMAPPVRGGYHEFRVQYVEKFPIPNWTDAQKLMLKSLASNATALANKQLIQQDRFARRVPDLSPPEREAKLSNKLKDWWQLPDFSAFRAEVKKIFKADIPLNERNDWEDMFNEGKAEITRLDGEIKAAEDEINRIVYDLFDLTLDEIRLLEESLAE